MTSGHQLMTCTVTAYCIIPQIIKRNTLRRDAEVVKHGENGGVHHRRSAEVILHLLRQIELAQVIVKQHLVNESRVAGPVIFGQRFGEGDIEFEVREVLSSSLNSFS